MGYHYFNKALIDDLVVDVGRPEGLGLRTQGGREPQARRRGVRRPGPRSDPHPGRVRAADRARPKEEKWVVLVPAVGW